MRELNPKVQQTYSESAWGGKTTQFTETAYLSQFLFSQDSILVR